MQKYENFPTDKTHLNEKVIGQFMAIRVKKDFHGMVYLLKNTFNEKKLRHKENFSYFCTAILIA